MQAPPAGLSYVEIVAGANRAFARIGPTDTTWTNLAGASTSSAGQPSLIGSGTLVGGAPASLSLTNAPANALLLAWISFASQLLLFANGSGAFTAATTWPLGVPPGTGVWFQFLVQDGSVPDGITLSNGLKGTTP